MDAVHSKDDPTQIGDRVILPASFTCSPRWYNQKYQDNHYAYYHIIVILRINTIYSVVRKNRTGPNHSSNRDVV